MSSLGVDILSVSCIESCAKQTNNNNNRHQSDKYNDPDTYNNGPVFFLATERKSLKKANSKFSIQTNSLSWC